VWKKRLNLSMKRKCIIIEKFKEDRDGGKQRWFCGNDKRAEF